MNDATEAWFLASQAWECAALATPDVCKSERLLERAFRLTLRARGIDPDRAERQAKDARARYEMGREAEPAGQQEQLFQESA